MDTSTSPAPQRVGIIGTGRLGTVLARALQDAGHELVAASSRRAATRTAASTRLGVTVGEQPAAVARAADVTFLCVPDDAVAQVADELVAELAPGELAGRIVVLVSGSVPAGLLAKLKEHAGCEGARMHPLQTVTDETPPGHLDGVLAAVSASTDTAASRVRAIAASVGMRPFELREEDRDLWHAAATIAANAPVALLAVARELAVRAGVGEDEALAGMGRLAATAVDNAMAQGPERALTGPIVRGDAATVAAHVAQLDAAGERLGALYRELGRATAELAEGSGRLAPRDRARIDAALGERAGMRLARTAVQLDVLLAPARMAGRRIAFVPTMGALHDGHLELVRRAREVSDVVVVSCYVNPLQFGAGEDLDRYPRTPEQDEQLLRDAGADVLWRPGDADVHEAFAELVAPVQVGGIGERFEGASRPGHFDGVATVVARLLAAVRPDVLVLGQKDLQQVTVVRRLLRRLAVPVTLLVVATVRESDGVARSSRNAYLSERERAAAAAIPRALGAAQELVAGGERDGAEVVAAVRATLEAEPLVEVDYVQLVDTESFTGTEQVGEASALIVAVRIGSTRLIDNVLFNEQGRGVLT